jgi:hypothetical protein
MSRSAAGQQGRRAGAQERRSAAGQKGRAAMRVASCVATLLVLALAGRVAAHPGHDHTVMGTVKAIENGHLEVEAKDGKVSTFMLTETTKILRGKVKATAADIKVGERVVAIGAAPPKDAPHAGGHPAGMLIAREVRLAAETKRSSAGTPWTPRVAEILASGSGLLATRGVSGPRSGAKQTTG